MIATRPQFPPSLVSQVTFVEAFVSAVLAGLAWHTDLPHLADLAAVFSLGYLVLWATSLRPDCPPWYKHLAVTLLSLQCALIATLCSLTPVPTCLVLPSLIVWLSLYHDHVLLRVVGAVHLALAVALATLYPGGVYEAVWLNYFVAFVVIGFFLLASSRTLATNKAYWFKMRDLELELTDSEEALTAVTARLEAQNRHLEHVSATLQTTAALNAQQLHELRFANEECAQIARTASSDLKQPLRNIVSFVQLIGRRLERMAVGEDVREYLAFVTDGAARMTAMVDDLLRYSADPDQIELRPVETSLTAEFIARNLRDLLLREGGTLAFADDLPAVLGQPTQVMQLFQNLISNGIKFRHPERAPACRVTWERVGEYVRFGVHDNGIGIPATRLGDVFGLFTRLHERGAYEGTGIGLATCRRLVLAMGGEIWAESEEGSGATFYFTLREAQPVAVTDSVAAFRQAGAVEV